MLTFNDRNIRDYVYRVLHVQRDVMPPRDIKLISTPNSNVSHIGNKKYIPRTHMAKIQIVGKTLSELRTQLRRLTKVLHTDDPAKLVFHDDPNVYFNAITTNKTDIDEKKRIASVDIYFLCADPYAYDEVEQTKKMTANPFIIDLTDPDRMAESVPVFDIQAKTNISEDIEVIVNDKSIRIIRNFSNLDRLVIGKSIVKYNGQTFMEGVDWRKSHYPKFKDGKNIILIRSKGSNLPINSLDVNISYRIRTF